MNITLNVTIKSAGVSKIVFKGLVRELNPGPLAPEARIIPLDQRALLFKMSKIENFI